MNYPCNEKCVTYAICLNKTPSEKVKVCPTYKEFLRENIKISQEKTDREDKGACVKVIAITTPDGVVDKNGIIYNVDSFWPEPAHWEVP